MRHRNARRRPQPEPPACAGGILSLASGATLRAMSKPTLVLAAPVRTPIGKFGGGLAGLSAADLGTHAAKAAIARSGLDPAAIDQVIFGHGRQAGGGPNTARQIGYRAGAPVARPARTIN